jgi:DNA-binding CsgD family transcriptional regulator
MNIDLSQFTEREKDTLKLLLQGKGNKQIALELGIANRTVEFHLGHIYAKLGVSSRTEAILKLSESDLRKSTGDTENGYQGKSTVEVGSENADNDGRPISQRRWTVSLIGKAAQLKKRWLLYGLAAGLMILIIGAIVWLYTVPTPWTASREGENPDEYTVGQMIGRSNASGSNVHGQFGTTSAAPWPAQFGYVKYSHIKTPRVDQLTLKLRYSKNSPSSVSILIYMDDEPTPRASLYPVDQGDWNNFVWTEPILLGNIKSGVHSIMFYTKGQQYGVADLDKFVLAAGSP